MHAQKLGLAGGIIWGGILMLMTWIAMYSGYGILWLSTWMDLYPGFDFSFLGSFLGLIFGFIHGFVVLLLLGWLYNRLS